MVYVWVVTGVFEFMAHAGISVRNRSRKWQSGGAPGGVYVARCTAVCVCVAHGFSVLMIVPIPGGAHCISSGSVSGYHWKCIQAMYW